MINLLESRNQKEKNIYEAQVEQLHINGDQALEKKKNNYFPSYRTRRRKPP